VEELLLGVVLALEELDVVDEEDVDLAVAQLELLGAGGVQGGDEFAREVLRRRVANAERGSVVALAPSRWVLPRPGGPWRKSGL
jgi:hypothetical protein